MNKLKAIEEAIAAIPSGASLMIGGFGSPGTPFTLINELVRQGQKNLTLIKNDANEVGVGISHLVENGQVDRLITTHIGLNKIVVGLMNDATLDVSFYPQGILAEKIRTAGAGSYGFLSDIGIDTEITDPAEIIEWDGKRLKIEKALTADFALLHAAKADTFGNLVYDATAMNFSPLMAMAADQAIVETANVVNAGQLAPGHIHTPSIFVNALVQLPQLGKEYAIMENHFEHH